MRRRSLLKGIGATPLLTVPSIVRAQSADPIVLKGTPADPITPGQIEDVVRDNKGAITTSDLSKRGHPPVPLPGASSKQAILGFAFGMSETGPHYKMTRLTAPTGQHDMSNGAGNRVSENNGEYRDQSTSQQSRGPDTVGEAHDEIDDFVDNKLSSSETVSIQDECIDSELLRDTTIDGFPCPWVTGEDVSYLSRSEDGYFKDGTDHEGRLIVQDQLFDGGDAIGTASYVVCNPSPSYPGGDDHVAQKSYVRHAYDENTDHTPNQRVVANPEGTKGEQINSASVSVGKESLGIGLGWDNVKVNIDFNTNQRLAQWDTAFKADRGSTKTMGYTSIANYDYDKISSGDDVLRCVVEGTFAKKVFDFFYDHDTFRTSVVYSR